MKTINIPRITEGDTYPVKILKGQSFGRKLTLCSQIIETVTVPKGSVIHLDNYYCVSSNHTGDISEVPVEYVNKLIRYLYLETLRNQS